MLDLQLLPLAELRTPRLVLRRITPADAPALFALRTDAQVLTYLDREPENSLADIEALIGRIDENLASNTGVNWAVARAEDEAQLIGTCGLWRLIPEHHRGEIGYMLSPAAWGAGLMAEAAAAVCRYGFEQLKLHSIEGNVNPHNAASIRLLEQLGFVREAYFRENYYCRGQFLDSAIYSLLAPRQ
ncbi:GNAT family N-acetyltransferase [Hymenobacter jeollabukensis]|uniref:GNAT family N-acetyltransferase n=1 Tax=Hymenobacter jeollabukensis TaxID=2025313 RepID=A0A5R8WMT3_9BACT|nr:GNAT family protein [Hymenobacter jeollabukensis]TLM90399.1 GNAT family N-acetyltransferase [Hymenobacter jeollabukensis]